MSASVNKVILVGRLGKDPDVRYTGGGQAVANFSLATDESFKNREGEKQKRTEWHSIIVWGKLAENVVKPYLHSGDMVYLEGKIQTREWTDREENKRTAFEIVVSEIRMLQTNGNKGEQTASSNTRRAAQDAAPEVSDEEIPF